MKSSFFTARTAMNAFETSSEDKKTDETPYPCHKQSKSTRSYLTLTVYIALKYKQNLGLQWWCSAQNL